VVEGGEKNTASRARLLRLEHGSGGELGADRVEKKKEDQRLGHGSGGEPRAGREERKKEGQCPVGDWASSVSSDIAPRTCREQKQQKNGEKKMKKSQCCAGSWACRRRDVRQSLHNTRAMSRLSLLRLHLLHLPRLHLLQKGSFHLDTLYVSRVVRQVLSAGAIFNPLVSDTFNAHVSETVLSVEKSSKTCC